jgi:hypothetical protein
MGYVLDDDANEERGSLMPHAKSLRAIGQSLESFGVRVFEIEKDGRDYVVRSDALPSAEQFARKKSLSEKIWEPPSSLRKAMGLAQRDGSFRYVPSYVSWLDSQGRRKRRRRFSTQASATHRLSQLLRTLGRHVDRAEPHALQISWTENQVTVSYEPGTKKLVTENLTIEKLRELTLRMRFRRSRRVA